MNVSIIASSSSDGTVKIWDVSTEEVISTLLATIEYLCFSPCGRYLGAVGNVLHKTIIVWRCDTWEVKTTITGLMQMMDFDCTGEKIISVSFNGSVSIWCVESGTELIKLQTAKCCFAVLSPDGSRVAVAVSKQVDIHDSVTGELINTLKGPSSFVRCVRYSQDGCFIISAGMDCLLTVWDLVSGEMVQQLRGHQLTIRSLHCCLDGERSLSFSANGLRLWNLPQNECLLDINFRHRDDLCSPVSAAFSEDTNSIVTGNSDGSIAILDSATGRIIRSISGAHSMPVRLIACRNVAAIGSFI